MEYNIKIIRYANNKSQIRIYGSPIHIDDKIAKRIKQNYAISNTSIQVAIDNEIEILEEKELHSKLNSISRTKQMIYKICRSNIWDYFVTITFDPQRANRQNYDSILSITTEYLKALKRKYKDFVYILVPELHTDGVSWHMHGLFKNIPETELIFSGKYDSHGLKIYNLKHKFFGWTTLTKVKDNDKVTMYMCKYITKEMCVLSKNRKRYLASNNCLRPQENNYYIQEPQRIIKFIQDKLTYVKTIDFNDSSITYLELDNADYYLDLLCLSSLDQEDK